MSPVRLIHQHLHAVLMGKLYNLPEVGTDAVVGGVVHQHSHGVGVLLDGLCHLLPLHAHGGSLTQSSLLLIGPNVHPGYVRQIINLTQTTSGSYLLMSSLDISRRNLALHGQEIFDKVTEMVEYARKEINQIGDYYAYSRELVNGDSVYDFDVTKLSVNTLAVGLAGIEVYDLLRDEYDIQIEFGDICNILAYISICG